MKQTFYTIYTLYTAKQSGVRFPTYTAKRR